MSREGPESVWCSIHPRHPTCIPRSPCPHKYNTRYVLVGGADALFAPPRRAILLVTKGPCLRTKDLQAIAGVTSRDAASF